MSDEFWQLVSFTRATSNGSAKVMSTHWPRLLVLQRSRKLIRLKTYTVERCSVYGSLNDLNGSIVANLR